MTIEERRIAEAEYMVEHNTTIRKCARNFNVCNSTVHRDLHILISDNPNEYCELEDLISLNTMERHIRAGEATRIKFEKLRANKVKNKDKKKV